MPKTLVLHQQSNIAYVYFHYILLNIHNMEDILKCLKATEDLKRAVLDQQNLIKQLLIVFKNPKNYRCCPMCETIFENEYDAFEEHVMSHFEIENSNIINDTSEEEEETLSSLVVIS